MSMNRSQFRKQLQLGLNSVFGLEYKRYPEEWKDIFDVETSIKAYEEDVLMSGLGAAQVKGEGAAVAYDSGAEAWVSRYTHITIALAFAITKEAEEDGLYGSIGKKYSSALARSMQYTKEIYGANVLNNAYSGSFLGGDGVSLLSTAHPLTNGGTFANKLATDADFSETSLEDALVAIGGFTDERGIPVMTKAMRIIGPRQIEYTAARVLKSTQRVGTADNDINATKALGSVPDGFSVNHYLTSTDAWFIKTDIKDGLKHFSRKSIERGLEGDFETDNMRYKARERYSFGWTDPRGIFGSQ